MRFTLRPSDLCVRVGTVAVLATTSLWACGDAAHGLSMSSNTSKGSALGGAAGGKGDAVGTPGCGDLVTQVEGIVESIVQILPAVQNHQDISALVNQLEADARALADDIRACQGQVGGGLPGGGGIPAKPVSGDVAADEGNPSEAAKPAEGQAQEAVGQQAGEQAQVQQQAQAQGQYGQFQGQQQAQAQGQYGQAQGEYGQGQYQGRHHHHHHR
jgi:hypothetical protein